MSENEVTGLPVKGYKATQPQEAIDAVNHLKELEERTLRALEGLPDGLFDPRMRAIAITQLQGGFMWAARSIFQPGRISLPEDAVQSGSQPLPDTKADAQLGEIVRAFIRDQAITCAEATNEDRVYESAPEFVEKLAEVVGYAHIED